MDIENVFALGKQLQDLGFGDLSGKLARQICFQPQGFTVSHAVQYDGTEFTFHITFGLEEKQRYVGQYFDAAITTPTPLPNTITNEVNASELNERMSRIDWRKAFDFANVAALNPTDKLSWAIEEKIEAIVKDLQQLEGTAEGKRVASHLKEKHWRNLVSFDTNLPAKRKAEISQRFYFFGGRQIITVDEACRFLKNRELERQLNEFSRKRLADIASGANRSDNGNGLLTKRHTSKATKDKKRLIAKK